MLFLAKLLDLVPNWVYALLLVGAGLYMFGQSREITGLQKELATVQNELGKEKTARAAEKLLAISEMQRIAGQIRASTHLFETSLTGLTNAYTAQLKARDGTISLLRRDGRMYRDDIRNFSTSQPDSTDSTESALLDCRNRVATLGDILERTDEFAERLTGEAETRIEQVRILQKTVFVLDEYIQSFAKNFKAADIQ